MCEYIFFFLPLNGSKESTMNLPSRLSCIINLHLPVKGGKKTTTQTQTDGSQADVSAGEMDKLPQIWYNLYIIFREVSALIAPTHPPPAQFGSCVYFQNLQRWSSKLRRDIKAVMWFPATDPHRSGLFLMKCLRFVCALLNYLICYLLQSSVFQV